MLYNSSITSYTNENSLTAGESQACHRKTLNVTFARLVLSFISISRIKYILSDGGGKTQGLERNAEMTCVW